MIEPELRPLPRTTRAHTSAVMRSVVLPCSFGMVVVAASPTGITTIALGDDEPTLRAYVRARFPAWSHEGADSAFARDAGRVASSLAAPDSVEALLAEGELVFDLRGTPFQLRVWQALREIPPGETTTYGDLAARIGAKGAVRAVGTACGQNPMAVLIPCHRVLRSDGGLGGFRWGLERKRELLRREGWALRARAPASRP